MPNRLQNTYFPLWKGQYEVSPGLNPLGKDFGQGVSDNQIFQFDNNFSTYRNEKIAARNERLDKYYITHNLTSDVKNTVVRFIAQKLCLESPHLFNCHEDDHLLKLECKLTGETLKLNSSFQLQSVQPDAYQYVDNLDAIAMQIQEDLAIIQCASGSQDFITALHLCFPNYWAAEEKIGKGFITTHASVPGMDKINQRASQLVDAMINKGPFVRFAWGLTTDNHLNHHPAVSIAHSQQPGSGRQFDPKHPQLYLRVERQVIYGFPDLDVALFTIRTYFYDVGEIKKTPIKRDALISALNSMSPEAQIYKGLTTSLPAIMHWLKRS